MMAIKTDGTLWGWGKNEFGQIGLGTSAAYVWVSSPAQVGALTNWSRVTAGGNFTIASKTDGTLWAWGQNNNGQLGQGNLTYRSSPVQVGALTTWLFAAAGYIHTAVTKTDGTLWAWGGNAQGQLGLGNTVNRSSPVQVGALTTWKSVAMGNNGLFTIATSN